LKIAEEIEQIRGNLPFDLQMELDYLQANKSR